MRAAERAVTSRNALPDMAPPFGNHAGCGSASSKAASGEVSAY